MYKSDKSFTAIVPVYNEEKICSTNIKKIKYFKKKISN